jgi:hypothetical protein
VAEATTTPTNKKTRTVKQQTYRLVEVEEEEGGIVFTTLPVPEGTDLTGRTPIMRAVKAAIAAGDTSYDDKKITVIAYVEPVLVKSEPVVVKRKVSFE